MAPQKFKGPAHALSAPQREALSLVGASGFSYEEAARIAGCAEGTMKSRVCRARLELARRLAQASPPDLPVAA